jgi:hypothetical protein
MAMKTPFRYLPIGAGTSHAASAGRAATVFAIRAGYLK